MLFEIHPWSTQRTMCLRYFFIVRVNRGRASLGKHDTFARYAVRSLVRGTAWNIVAEFNPCTAQVMHWKSDFDFGVFFSSLPLLYTRVCLHFEMPAVQKSYNDIWNHTSCLVWNAVYSLFVAQLRAMRKTDSKSTRQSADCVDMTPIARATKRFSSLLCFFLFVWLLL